MSFPRKSFRTEVLIPTSQAYTQKKKSFGLCQKVLVEEKGDLADT